VSDKLNAALKAAAIKEIAEEISEAQTLAHKHLVHYYGCEYNEDVPPFLFK